MLHWAGLALDCMSLDIMLQHLIGWKIFWKPSLYENEVIIVVIMLPRNPLINRYMAAKDGELRNGVLQRILQMIFIQGAINEESDGILVHLWLLV